MQFKFLGTAAAEGYPALFCNCANCTEARQVGGKSLRKRSAALINDELLIDLGPDLIPSSQQHNANLSNIKYCLQTHEHSDHLDATNITWRFQGFSGTPLPTLHWYGSTGVFQDAAQQLHRPELDAALLERANIVVHPVEPGQQFEVGPYRVSSVLASHGGGHITVQLYIIGDGQHTIFYCTDTGLLSEEGWKQLRADGRKIDMLAMDETMGIGPSGSMHLNTDDFLQQLQQMRDEGILAPDARIYAHHFSHHRNPIHPKLSDFFAPHGVEVAYDGLTIDL